MDHFVKGFARQPLARTAGPIASLIRYGAKVTGIETAERRGDRPLRATSGSARTLDRRLLRLAPSRCRSSRSSDQSAARLSCRRPTSFRCQAAGKVGWQADRFWETSDQIYGGISWTTDDITQIWYPSSGFLGRKGVLTGAYMYGEGRYGSTPDRSRERLQIAKDQGERLHPGYARHGRARHRHRLEPDGVRALRLGRRGRPDLRRRTPRSWQRRRAASTWPATRSPTGAAGRKARSSAPGRR